MASGHNGVPRSAFSTTAVGRRDKNRTGRGGSRVGRGGSRAGHGGSRTSGRVTLGFNALQKLCDKDPDDIVLDLASERCLPAFRALLQKADMSKNMVELVVEVLARACDSNSPEYFNKLLVELPTSLFVILSLKSYITIYIRGQSHSNTQSFIERTVKLFSEILKRIPSAVRTLPLEDLDQLAGNLVMLGQISGDVAQRVEELKAIKEGSLEKERRKIESENQRRIRSQNPGVDTVGPPPEDFREMTIVPERNDIFADAQPYLRRNIVEGAYENLNHYLDVQFRLLREDFFRPLREGIINVVNYGIDERKGTFKDIRVYRNVKVLYPVCLRSGLRHVIQFDNSRLKRVMWENSKRLIFGSLLCLSKDQFQTFVFATVADRDPKELAHGKITVHFMESTFDLQDFSRQNVYEMVETTAYFEAYSPVLKGLQETEDRDLPFQRYLIECNKDVQAPQYLQRDRLALTTPSFNFSSILTDNVSSSMGIQQLQRQFQSRLSLRHGNARVSAQSFNNVPVLNEQSWPSKEQLSLDESQYKALKIALTKEVAVIQGPPGTGKTYLGLKIAKLLLSNTNTWIYGEATIVGNKRQVNRTPILVICYTNHALDQFLEGIYDFYSSNENKIVRIGGRSKSEKLKDCNMSAMKKNDRVKSPSYVKRGMWEVYSQLEAVEKTMKVSSNIIKKCWQNILFESTLQKSAVVKQQHLTSLKRPFIASGQSSEQGSIVLQWLNLVAGDMENEEIVVFGKEARFFDGSGMAENEGLPLGNTDFSLCVHIKTRQAGNIVANLPKNRRWMPDSKALCIDATGVIKFVSGDAVICESHSRVNNDKWHEIAVVYSKKNDNLTLYIDKRIERVREGVRLPDESQEYSLKIGVAPRASHHPMANFVGLMKNFVYYCSTKYNEMVMGDVENVEYEVDFIQDQRRVDDDDDGFNNQTPGVPVPDDFDVVDPAKLGQGSGEWQVQNKRKVRSKINFEIRKQLQSEDVMSEEEAERIRDVWQLPVNDRWRLYRRWVRDISQRHQNTIARVQDEYEKGMKQLQELRNAQNYELLREAHVIGMTTTGAAKFRNLLHRIKPKITIVEEAAEVLESHIVTALTGGCEHLILIGDHKQLRPKPTVFQLGLDYQLDISLFERMVENGMPYACLQAQHRMRPEISLMMRPIYDNLIDHDSVLNFETVKGINKNIFFVDHQIKEDALDENQSHSNIHEAKFIGALCVYLLQQGYSPSKITVLTPYSGQLFQLKKFVPKEKDLRICVVDNFQGEENDIILLSLVRSQDMTGKDKKNIRRLIGFLAIDNRICVSLSRAKKGFFCIGNLTLMKSANDLWAKILDDMEQRGCVGPSLPLACQNHPMTITSVTNDVDFKKAPNGGCSVPCQARLKCGHKCEQICHPTDPLHEEYNCMKKCTRTCERGHPCGRRCYQQCNDCTVKVSKCVPRCQHVVVMLCHQDPASFQCTHPCRKVLPCGHVCPKKCGEACATKCLELVEKTWSSCGHTKEVQCYVDPTRCDCPQPCRDILKCEHICAGTCGRCKQGRVHQPCSSRCDRVQFCDHQCKVPCTKNCPPCPEKCPNRCAHSKCQKKCGEPCEPCRESCDWQCEHLRCEKLCGELCDRPRCNRPCMKRLSRCRHRCPGLCGEPCPKKCLICDKDELTEIFFGYEDEEDARFLQLADCSHVFEVKGMDNYMDMKEKELKKGQSTSIQMIKCPKCNRAIRTSLRYGNIVKKTLQNFEQVKKALSSKSHVSRRTFQLKIEQEIGSVRLAIWFPSEVEHIESKTQSSLTTNEENVIENQVQFLKFAIKLKQIITQAESVKNGRLHANLRPRYGLQRTYDDTSATSGPEVELMKDELKDLLQWVTRERERFSEQELEDFNEELHRARLMFSYLALRLEITERDLSLDDTESKIMAYMKRKFETGDKVGAKDRDMLSKWLEYLTRSKTLSVKYTTVTEEEKKIIVQAVGLSQGHWFKCPKGHIYCIGECGGATQEGKCPECGSRIGGTQHRLLSDNSLASEMDGAVHAAWSDTANNMRNWDLRNIR